MYKAALFLSSLLISPAMAAIQPVPAIPLDRGGDPHVRTVIATPGQQVVLTGAVGRPMTIVFSPKEHIEHIPLEPEMPAPDGVSKIIAPIQAPASGEIGPQGLRNILPLWFMRAGRSNGQVTTRAEDGSSRVYPFAFIILPKQPDTCDQADCDNQQLITELTLLYPDEHKQEVKKLTVAAKAEQAQQDAIARLKTSVFYGDPNWKYVIKGTEESQKILMPDKIFDNTQSTAFVYFGRRAVPSIYMVTADDEDKRLVTPEPDKDMLVVYEAITGCLDIKKSCPHWQLRSGNKYVVNIYSKGQEDGTSNPWTGTIASDVQRIPRVADAK
jgi:type IV secretory pathway VirB9-like protein